MNLTIQSLNQAREACERYLDFEDVLASEERYDLIDNLRSTMTCIDNTLNLTSNVLEMKASLETNGYSEEWFESVAKNSRLEGVVSFDMPKFFDNPTNRGKACMEGFLDSIKNFIVKICDFIMDVIRKVLKFFGITIGVMGDDSEVEVRLKEFLKLMQRTISEAQIDKYLQLRGGLRITKLFNTQNICIMFDNVYNLLGIVLPGTDFNKQRSGILDANEYEGRDTPSIRNEYFEKLQMLCLAAGLKVNDIRTGFILAKDNPGTSSLVKFAMSDIPVEEPQSTERDIKCFRDLQNLVEFESNTISAASKRLYERHKSMKEFLTKRVEYTQAVYNKAKNRPQDMNDPDILNFFLREFTANSCSLNIVCSAQRFLLRMSQYRRANNKAKKALMEVIQRECAENSRITK